MLRRGGLIVIGLVLLPMLVFADIADTVIALEKVVAKGVRFDNYTLGAKVVHIDSFVFMNNRLNSVAELLSTNSSVNMTSYGPGGQASVKIRGGGADHTTVIWNGLNIKPPMSGEINFSAINCGTFENIVIQPGGSSSMYGSGAATGIVFLSTHLPVNNLGMKTSLNAEWGSFSSYGIQAKTAFSGKRFSSRINFSHQESENNYHYKYGKKDHQQEHAARQTYNLSQQNTFLLGQKSKLETDIWYVYHFKEVPALTSDTKPGTSEQTDKNLRLALNYSYYLSNFSLKYRGGLLADNIYYVDYDTLTGFESMNKCRSIINEVETKISFSNNYKLYVGLNNTVDFAGSDYYTNKARRYATALFGRLNTFYFEKALQFSFEGRQELVDAEAIPFIYSLGSTYNITQSWQIKALFSKLYSLPDLNDLYWAEDAFARGNPHLEPEKGWNTEFGMAFTKTGGIMDLTHEVTVFSYQMYNAIIWLPGIDGKWMPENYTGTLSKGFEYNGSNTINFTGSSLKLMLGYSYTNTRVTDEDKGISDEQKTYTPKHQANIGFVYSFSGIYTGITTAFVGERLRDKVSSPLDPYLLIDYSLSYNIPINKSDLNIQFKIKNILNTSYVVLAGYAQPPRSINTGITYNF